ncbi:molybdopterin-dependent oxidoreductase [Brevibacterium jeotgali]|nr:molybdopterin-dependent oxidoreductase [Brevibacterium jeotgali]
MGHLTRIAPGLRTRGALAGVAATLLLLGSADALARVLGASTSPLTAVGLLVIRVLPTDLVKLAITLFGESDKIVLILTVGVAGLVIGGLIGGLLCTRPHVALLTFTLAEAVLILLVGLRPEAGPPDLIASAAGSVLAAFSFALLLGARRRPGRTTRQTEVSQTEAGQTDASQTDAGRTEASQTEASQTEAGQTDAGRTDAGQTEAGQTEAGRTDRPAGFGRRGFFLLAGASAMVGAVGIAAGRTVVAVGRGAAEAARRFVLPAPAVPAPPVPDGAEVGVDGVAPFTTAQADLYRIDTALVPPAVDPDAWELRVDGLVEEPFTLTFDELLAMRLEEHRITLTCVSNPVGGGLLGTGTWTGVPVRTLLARAKPLPEADMVLSRSIDGFTASTPLEAMTDDRASLVAVGMNGEPLTPEHGYPVRLIVPGLYGFVSATKWVTRIEVTRFDRAEAYWTQRGWDAKAPILVASRIDVPRGLDSVSAGEVVVAGSAWAQGVGIAEVQVRLDDGEWTAADLGAEANADTWRQWRVTLPEVESGRHSVTVRAVDQEGTVQTEERRTPIPNAATGHHRVEFRAE